MRLFLSLIFILIGGAVFAQSKKNKNTTTSEQGVANSLNPNSTKTYDSKKSATYGPKKTSQRRKAGSVTHDSERNYYARVEAVSKARKKAEKEMQKPQYSDPLYFGHKNPPKKRAPHKMKFCKECGIRH